MQARTVHAPVQAIKPVMVPVFCVLNSPDVRSTAHFPPPLNMAPLPPMIVTEQGEPLDDFLARAESDFYTSIQVRLPPSRVWPRDWTKGICCQGIAAPS